MKLKQLKLQNFRGYKDETVIDFDDLVVLIGKNDAGKSSLFDALVRLPTFSLKQNYTRQGR